MQQPNPRYINLLRLAMQTKYGLVLQAENVESSKVMLQQAKAADPLFQALSVTILARDPNLIYLVKSCRDVKQNQSTELTSISSDQMSSGSKPLTGIEEELQRLLGPSSEPSEKR